MYPLDIKLMIGKPHLCFLVKVACDKIQQYLVYMRTHRGIPLHKFDTNNLYATCECGNISIKRHPISLTLPKKEPL